MIRFAELLDGLLFTPARNGKLRLTLDYFESVPDPERGWALAALTGELSFREAKPAQIRALAESRVDAELFRWSYDFVGDLAETVALIWPERPGANDVPGLTQIVEGLALSNRGNVGALLERWLDALDATGRWALLKLVTGGLRIGVSARLAKTALAEFGHVGVEEIEEVWHGLRAPYEPLFAWLTGKASRPETGDKPVFLPLMLANPLDEADLPGLDPGAYLAEWKWDGIRVQLSCRGGEKRIYSRTGDEVTGAFPDLVAVLPDAAILDGELLTGGFEAVGPFNDLQQRLNRKLVNAKLMQQYPAFVRLYDALWLDGEDLRPSALSDRRQRLEEWYRRAPRPRLDLSPILPFESWGELAELRAGARAAGIEGLMLKQAATPYLAGRPKGPWFKWKRGALTLDCVVMYAQRGHGKRSSFYSDYTFGAWRGEELVPVGKAYSGFTDQELLELDRWVRHHTTNKFGPVREVEPGLVLEIAFDSVHRSTRHKSGLAMRFPRVHRIRWDKPPAEADRVETLSALIVE
ncbi:MAG TPA: cisplatin damage response ATP-dependent DNA ligase [Aliidongia sp.]|nr:cisplatin damage response ATP-dependent DNA ligase [Aliidongia sp.]